MEQTLLQAENSNTPNGSVPVIQEGEGTSETPGGSSETPEEPTGTPEGGNETPEGGNETPEGGGENPGYSLYSP